MMVPRLIPRRWPGWLRSSPRRLLAGILVGCLGFGALLHLGVRATLQQAEAAAERAALARVDRAAETVVQLIQRNLEGIDLYFELLRDMVRARAEDLPILPGIEYRLRSFTGAQRFGVYQATHVDPGAIIRWTNFTGVTATPLLDRPRYTANLVEDVGLYVSQPVLGRFSNRWGIEFTRRLTFSDGSYAGVAALALDPAALTDQLRALRTRPEERISLWRHQGERLVTTDDNVPPNTRIAATLRPGPDGRLLVRLIGPRTGEDRFYALRTLEGVPLFFSVSRLAGPEMAEFQALRRAVWWAEALLFLLGLAGAGLGWLWLNRRWARQQQMEAQRAELARVLDGVQAAVGLLEFGPDGKHRRSYLSAGAGRLLRAPGALRQDEPSFSERMEPPLSPAENLALFEQLRDQGQVSFERQTRCEDGTLRWMRYARSVIGRTAGGLEVVSLVIDIEQQKAAEAAAISSARLATLGELSANLAHEMNQPLTVISLSAEAARLMAEMDDKVALLAALERIMAMLARIRATTDHLRLFARKQEAELDHVRLDRVLAGALLLTAASLREADIELEHDLPADLPEVLGRQVLLEQVLMNLLLNARDAMAATPAGHRRIRISAEADGRMVRVQVADSGPGVPEALLPRLFEPFFTTKPAGLGTGLGLSICHGILQACGGEIAVANRPEGGAVFTLSLQRATGWEAVDRSRRAAEPAERVPEPC